MKTKKLQSSVELNFIPREEKSITMEEISYQSRIWRGISKRNNVTTLHVSYN